MGRIARTLSRGTGRILLGVLLAWLLLPVLAVVGFLGWGVVAADGAWRLVFAGGLALILLAAGRWGARLHRERRLPTGGDDSPI